MPDSVEEGNKKEQITAIESEFKRTCTFYENYIHPLYDKAWKQYLKDGEDRRVMGRLKDWESNVYASVSQKFVDVMFSNYYDSEIFIKVAGIDEKGRQGEKKVKRLFDEVIEKTKVRPQLDDVAKDSFVCGNGYLKAGWVKEDVEVTRIRGGKKTTFKVKQTELPTAFYRSNYHVMPEPMAKTIDSAQYVYELRFMNLDNAAKAYLKYFQMLKGNKVVDEKAFKSFVKSKVGTAKMQDGLLKRYDPDTIKMKVLMAKAQNLQLEWNKARTESAHIGTENIGLWYDESTYEFVERWSNEKLYVLANGKELFSVKNPLPVKAHPYGTIRYSKITNTFLGVGICYNVKDTQEIINSIWNIRLDSEKISGVPVFTRKRSPNMDLYEGDEEIEFSPGKIIPVNETDELKPLVQSNNAAVGTLQQELKDLSSDAMEAVGLNEYVLGTQGKVERSAAGVKALVQSFKVRLRPFIVSMNETMDKMAWLWFTMILAWGDENLSIDEEGELQQYKLEDIAGRYHFTFDAQSLFSTTRDLEKEALNQAMPMLITLGRPGLQGEPPVIDLHELVTIYAKWFDMPEQIVLPKQEPGTPGMENGPLDLGALMGRGQPGPPPQPSQIPPDMPIPAALPEEQEAAQPDEADQLAEELARISGL